MKDRKYSGDYKRLSYTVEPDFHKALHMLRVKFGYDSIQEMIEVAMEEKYGGEIEKLKEEGYLNG